MRIPYPERIKPWHAGCFATLLLVFELLDGTSPVFALCVFAYIMLAVTAFNIAGGLYTPSGSFVFANAVFSLILAVTVKVIVGEAADANLRDPLVSIIVYMAGMAGMLVAVIASRRFKPRTPLLDRGGCNEDLRQVSAGCIVAGILLPVLSASMNTGEGSVGSALNQFQYFIPLGLILGTYHEIRSSNGRRSMNGTILLGSLYLVIFGGILATSKTALLTPLACYIVVCGALRYRLRLFTVIGLGVVSFVLFFYLVPFAQVVRNYTRDLSSLSERWDASLYWLKNMDEVRAEYNTANADIALSHGPHYYNEDRGILERFGRIAMDDSLINITDINGTFGYQPMIVAVENFVPHFLWKDKPTYVFNNTYGHEIGLLAYEDFTTSISFSASAEAYHMGGWYSVFFLLPVVMTIIFIVVDSVAGNISHSPWGLVFIVYFLQVASEATLSGCLDVAIMTTTVLVTTVFFARYILPPIADAVLPEHRKILTYRKAYPVPKTGNLNVFSP